uniref:Uncharacterized protein n=1 Tax=Anguilla anguilla TaxID=7936 RepID=A0A0E9R1P5_ANGAN
MVCSAKSCANPRE